LVTAVVIVMVQAEQPVISSAQAPYQVMVVVMEHLVLILQVLIQTDMVVAGLETAVVLEEIQMVKPVAVLEAILVVAAILLKTCGVMDMDPHQVVVFIHQHMVQAVAVVLEFGVRAPIHTTGLQRLE
jgi:hypothetical protein